MSVTNENTEVHGCSYFSNALNNKMSDPIFDTWPLIALKYPHTPLSFCARSGQALKKALVLRPLVLEGKFKPCHHQQGISNCAGTTPPLGSTPQHSKAQGHSPLPSTSHFQICLNIFLDLLRKNPYVRNTSLHTLLVCLASSVSTSELVLVEAHPIYVSR